MKANRILLSLISLSVLTLGACGGETPKEGGQETSTIHQGEEFEKFVWELTPGNYTAKARYISKNGESKEYEATVTKTVVKPVSCLENGENSYKAVYDGHEETKTEEVLAYGEHEFGTPNWTWQDPDLEWAKATFVCNRDPSHIHEITVQREDMQETVLTPASCTVPGELQLTATVNFNGNEYSDQNVIAIQPTGDHEASNLGFCTVCGEYLGVESNVAEYINVGALEAGDTRFYSFPYVRGHNYKLADLTGISNAEIKVGVINTGAENLINLTDEYSTLEDESDDNKLYVAIKANGSIVDSGFTIISSHNYNSIGVCMADGDFNGRTITVGTTSESFPIRKNQTYNIRFKASEGHTYKRTYAGGLQTSDFTGIYYLDGNGWINSYDLNNPFPADSYDGYVYMNILSNYEMDAVTLTVNVKEHGASNIDDVGYCVKDGNYLGSDLTKGSKVTFSLDQGKTTYFRYEVPSDLPIILEVSATTIYGTIKLYYGLDDSYYEIEEDDGNYDFREYYIDDDNIGDAGYLYFVIRNSETGTKTYENFVIDELPPM